MTIVEPGAGHTGAIARIKGMLLKPGQTWNEVEPEPATVGGLYRGYVAPLAAIPPVCGLVGALLGGQMLFGVLSYRPSITWAIGEALITFGLSLGWVYVLALIVDGLAPRFEGQKNFIQALKLSAYAPTAAWIAGVFGLLPGLGALVGLAGALYSLYAFYLGLPKLMKIPAPKRVAYFLTILGISVAIALVIGLASAPLRMLAAPPILSDAADHEIVLPGQATLDLDDLEATTRDLSDAADAIREGRGGASDPDLLKALLPDTVAGYRRAEVSTGSGGMGGVSGSSAEGVYRKGEARIELSVADLGEAGKIAGLADALNLKSSQETDDAYQKVGKVDGRFTEESYDRAARHGEYSVLVAKRFMVKAEGDRASIEDVKTAARAVDFTRLERMAKDE
ncbi:Yip1 family protein [Phenylobacterium immobile]|uniref:Yip1 family protein n=1 Tax=Phenylobacterium immobile TaxID=21 RepID=UPI000A69D094|nr:Yip1 family protein [Phenylobacterium immobile]